MTVENKILVKKIQDNHTKLKFISLNDEEIVKLVKDNNKILEKILKNVAINYDSITSFNGLYDNVNKFFAFYKINNLSIPVFYYIETNKLCSNTDEALASLCLQNNIKESELNNLFIELSSLFTDNDFLYFHNLKLQYSGESNVSSK